MSHADIALDPFAGCATLAPLPARAHVSDDPFPPLPVIEGPAVIVSILALDLGTKTGYALRRRDGKIIHGTQDFTPRASWSPGQRGLRWRAWLAELLAREQPDVMAYEEIKRHEGVIAAHAYGLFQGLMWMAADTRNIRVQPYQVGHVKLFWTGAGNCDKDWMVHQAKVRGFRVVDDNDADAVALLHLAVADERGEWKAPVPPPKPKRKKAEAKPKRKPRSRPMAGLFDAQEHAA